MVVEIVELLVPEMLVEVKLVVFVVVSEMELEVLVTVVEAVLV